MIQLTQVRIEDCCRAVLTLAEDLPLRKGDACIIHTERGVEMGTVVHVTPLAEGDSGNGPYPRVLRKANAKDISQFERKRFREARAREACQQLVQKHNLVLKLTRVEFLFDGSKVIFYYTADGRVDFRGLVKDLASSLKTRIEMRQIGVRDEAKLLGGIGCCGLPLCCSTWIQKFYPVSIKTAKRQCLNLNPSRLSGVCGRLMCCLMYERDTATPTPATSPEEVADDSAEAFQPDEVAPES
jgi:cell fate regulator YaaT (PSP1 superfamily)